MKKNLFFLLGLTLVVITASLSGCYKEPVYSNIPHIGFLNLDKQIVLEQFSGAKSDSIIVSISFQDGDGDLGLAKGAEKDSAVKHINFNYVVKILESKKGIFSEKVQTEPYSGFFTRLKESDKAGPIEGTLNYSMNFQQPFTPKNDTIKFQIFIKDRAGNSSNTVETTPVILHQF